MHLGIKRHHRIPYFSVAAILALAVIRPPAAGEVVSGLAVELAFISERILRIPFRFVDHTRCFFPERLDSACPECL